MLLKNIYLDDAPFGKENRLKLREHIFGVHFQVSDVVVALTQNPESACNSFGNAIKSISGIQCT